MSVFSLGVFVEGIRSDRALLTKSEQIGQLKRERQDQKMILGSLKGAMNNLSKKSELLKSKTKFLHHYVSYISTNEETSKKIFTDYICAMWKKSEERQIHVDLEDLRFSMQTK